MIRNQEQEVCVQCGLCCDGTLFDIAIIQKDEFVGRRFIEQEVIIEGERFFQLPCPHFSSCCQIYDQEKPKRCTEFRCNLLKRIKSEEISSTRVLEIVKSIRSMRNELQEEFFNFTGKKSSFRELYKELSEWEANGQINSERQKLLAQKAILLQIQLTKYFRSKEDFDERYTLM